MSAGDGLRLQNAYGSKIQWAPIMLIVSLVAFFSGVSLLGFEGFNVIARENQGRLIAFFFLLFLALAFSWGAFINAFASSVTITTGDGPGSIASSPTWWQP